MTINLELEVGLQIQIVRAGLDAVRRQGDDQQARIALDLLAALETAVQKYGAAEHEARIAAQVEARLAEREP